MIKCASLDHKWVYHVSSLCHTHIQYCSTSAFCPWEVLATVDGSRQPMAWSWGGKLWDAWAHCLQRSVVTLPDSGSKALHFVAEHGAVHSSCSHNSPWFCLSKAPALGSPLCWWPGQQQKGLAGALGLPQLMHSSLSAEERPFLRGLRLPLGLPST